MSKRKKRILFLFIVLIFIAIIGTVLINLYMINSTKNQIIELNEVKDLEDVDAIIILGCKAYSDGPSLMLAKRLETGVSVYQLLNSKLLLSGDHGTSEYDEVNVMRDYIVNTGIDTKDIFLDHAGFNTYDSIYRAKYIFGVKKAVIITQKYHMYRALYIANKLDMEAVGVIASDIPQKGIMIKNEIREILSRDKNFFKTIFMPQSKYLGDKIPITGDGNMTNG